MKAVVLLSGGLDSATALYYAKSRGIQPHSLIFDYGQKHRREVEGAKKIAREAGSKYTVIKIDFPWGGSTLFEGAGALPQGKLNRIKKTSQIPSTYVPGRNTIFLAFAVSLAETEGAQKIFIGANAVDYSGYPDCRPVYVNSWNRLLRTLSANVPRIEAPLIKMTKAGIVKLGRRLKVPFEMTWSCYAGGREPCMKCDSCLLRAKGFAEAGIKDPLINAV